MYRIARFPRWRGHSAALLALATLLLLAACGRTSVTTQARTPTPTQMMPTPTPAQTKTPAPCNRATQWRAPANNVALDDLAMVAPDEGWAVGALTGQLPLGSGGPGPAGVIYHLTNGQWQRLPQMYAGAELSTISMDSPDDGWAASNSAVTGTGDRVLVLHYTGGSWQPVDVPALDAVLKGPPGTYGGNIGLISVQMFGPDAGWMFAYTNIPRDLKNPSSRAEVVILRYKNGAWTPIPSPSVPDTTELFMLSAGSADEAWIAGTDYGNDLTTIFAHYSGGAWSIWPRTFPGITAVFTMLTASDGWAFDSENDPALLLHYDGTAWTPAATPDWVDQQVQLDSPVFSVSPGVLWFPASQGRGANASEVIEQYSGGHWQQIAWPFGDTYPVRLAGVGPGEAWGIGNIDHSEGCPPGLLTDIQQGVFLHYLNRYWGQNVLP